MYPGKKTLVATGVALMVSATLILFPPFRSVAQTTNTKDSTKQEGKFADDKRKSPAMDRHNRSAEVATKEIERSLAELQRGLEELKTVDFSKISETVETALKAVDADQIRRSVEMAVKSVDMNQIQKSIESAMSQVNMDEIKKEVQQAMNEVDMKQVGKEVQNAMKELQFSLKELKSIDTQEIRKELEKARTELLKDQAELKSRLHEVQVEMQKTRDQFAEMTEIRKALEQDGLVKKGEKLNLEWKEGKLYINGKLQHDTVAEKYKKYQGVDIHTGGDSGNDL